VSRHRFEHFFYISLEAACSCLLRLKIEDTTEKFKAVSNSSHNYDLSNSTTYSQTQNGAIVPLILVWIYFQQALWRGGINRVETHRSRLSFPLKVLIPKDENSSTCKNILIVGVAPQSINKSCPNLPNWPLVKVQLEGGFEAAKTCGT
jgi:hypothetical protein